MPSLTIHLQLESPLLIGQLGGGDPNSSVGYNYIPGSTLRGAIIGRYLDGEPVDADDEDFRRLFLNGTVRYLNGYPLTSTGKRSLPMPRSWRQPKDASSDAPVRDWALREPAILTADNRSADGMAKQKDEQDSSDPIWKGMADTNFCSVTGSQVEVLAPTMEINIHIAREDRQRPTAGDAAIFRYDALAKGQTFAAIIVADCAADLTTIKKLLPTGTRLALGRSRSASYGWVSVHYASEECSDDLPTLQTEWGTDKQSVGAAPPPSQLIVTLLSDTLIRDPGTGAYIADLRPLLGVTAKRRFVELHKVGGFNRKWNLPLPQAEAIAAGSVFVYEYEAGLAQKLLDYTESGIGARRAEGFGRIALNWQSKPELTLQSNPDELPESDGDDSASKRPKVKASTALAEQMVHRMLRAELDRQLLAAINGHRLLRRGMSNSQLSRIRVVARHALETHHLHAAIQSKRIDRLADFLLSIKDSARNQLQRARISSPATDDQNQESTRQSPTVEPYYDWLTRLAVAPDSIWDILLLPKPLPAIGQIKATVTSTLTIEYVLRLIDGIAQLATREESHG